MSDAPDAANDPLIDRRSSDLDLDLDLDLDHNHSLSHRPRAIEVDESRVTTAGRFVLLLTLSAGVSGLLFGYDTGVISSTLVSIGSDLSSRPLTTLDKSLITSCTSFFALIASPITGALADTFGRKGIILFADVLFVLGAIWQACTASVWGMIGGRSVIGLAVGSASFVVPMFIGELSPSPFRGRMVTISSLFITGGQVVAYIAGWLLSDTPHGWRWLVGLGALPALVQIAIMLSMPDTPRWLLHMNRKEQAKRVLSKVYGADEAALVEGVLRRIEREIFEEDATVKTGNGSYFSMLRSKLSLLFATGSNRRALTIACLLQGLQQLCGFNSLMYFSATIFSMVGFRSPTLTSLSVACTNFVFTVVAFSAIDRIGRRRILLYSIPIMILGLGLCSVGFKYVRLPEDRDDSVVQRTLRLLGRSGLLSRDASESAWPLVILTAMIVYVAGYAIGLGNVPWQQSELFPLSVRSLGSGFSTMTNWTCNTLIGITFLPMMDYLTPVGTFAFYTVVCAIGWLLIWRVYPETCGLSLEDVGSLLRDGWGVHESVQRFRRRGNRH